MYFWDSSFLCITHNEYIAITVNMWISNHPLPFSIDILKVINKTYQHLLIFNAGSVKNSNTIIKTVDK